MCGACVHERAKNPPVFPVSIRQTLGMKLHRKQERKQAGRFRLQFHTLYHSISADRHRTQWFGDAVHSLVVRAVHAQYPLASYLGQ